MTQHKPKQVKDMKAIVAFVNKNLSEGSSTQYNPGKRFRTTYEHDYTSSRCVVFYDNYAGGEAASLLALAGAMMRKFKVSVVPHVSDFNDKVSVTVTALDVR